MIKYSLQCSTGHGFEGWFRSISDFEKQAEQKLLSCPVCSSDEVKKAIMSPAVSTSRKQAGAKKEARLREIKSTISEAASKARDYVEKNFDYVGEKFPEEARKIHYGETQQRGIFGEATGKEAKELADEGVSIAPLPGDSTKSKKKLS